MKIMMEVSAAMIYNIGDKIPIRRLIPLSVQMLLSVFVATTLIASICGVDMGAALVGAGVSCIIYTIVTKGQSPIFISNSGNYVAPVLITLAASGYTGVFIGGIVTFVIYGLFGLIFTKVSVDNIYKIFPPALIGGVTVVIGINLMGFIPTYLGNTGQLGILIALITTVTIALISHYAKGIFKILPFLVGILVGYLVALIMTVAGIANLVDLSVFNNMSIISIPHFAFTKFSPITFISIIPIVIIYIAFTISAMMECLADHAAASGIIGIDLYRKPGLGRIFVGEGIANLSSTFLGGLGACSYGEGVADVGFSKVASAWVTRIAALILIGLGFFGPVQAFITSIPSCVFAGAAIVLYGFIACSGVKMLQKTDLTINKNLVIVSVVLSLGISGIAIGGQTISISATALALIAGVIFNIVLKEKKDEAA